MFCFFSLLQVKVSARNILNQPLWRQTHSVRKQCVQLCYLYFFNWTALCNLFGLSGLFVYEYTWNNVVCLSFILTCYSQVFQYIAILKKLRTWCFTDDCKFCFPQCDVMFQMTFFVHLISYLILFTYISSLLQRFQTNPYCWVYFWWPWV